MEYQDHLGRFKKGTTWRNAKPWWDYVWLYNEYINKRRSARDIGEENGCCANNILFWLQKLNIPRRTVSEIREHKYWGSSGLDNPMWNKTGELNPRWRGGITAERQAFYMSREWKAACAAVWKRDNATCRRCQIPSNGDMPFHIHHIISFKDKSHRADVSNLALVCETCHHFIHSKRNIKNELLQEE